LSTPPITVASPSARSALAMSERVIRRSTISPVANTSPVVSTAVISMTTTIEMIAAAVKRGHPKKERRGHPEPRGVGHRAERGVTQQIQATPVPRTNPISTATLASEALNTPLDDHDQRQRAQRVGQVAGARRVRVRGAPDRVRRRHRQQRQPDDQDHRAGHHAERTGSAC